MSTHPAHAPAGKLGISVILCTYNGAARLPDTLGHLAAQQLPGHVAWEVLLIDNASTDNTPEVVQQAGQRHPGLPLRTLREPTPGKIHALTRGFRQAAYAYYVVCDDDCWLPPDYLRVAYEQMTAHPAVGIMNGPYQNVYDAEPPAWYRRTGHLVAMNTLGDRRLDITDDPGSIWGAGMVLRRRAYEELLAAGFTPALTGGLGAKRSAGEDTELCLAARLLGYRIVYEPALHFRHFVTVSRMQWQTLVNIARANGAASISYSDYRYHYARQQGKPYPVHTHWQTELRANLKFLGNARTWLRYFFGPAEGSPDVLRLARQKAKVRALLDARQQYDASFDRVGTLAAYQTARAGGNASPGPAGPVASSPGRIAFVCDNFPLTDNLNGASALNYSHLRLLLRALPGTTVHLVVLNHYAGFRFEAAKITAEFGEAAITVALIDFGGEKRCKGRKAHLLGWGAHPLRYFYPFLTGDKIEELREVLRAIGPDLIWTEHLVANLAVREMTPTVPVVYGHHDFLWKVARVRNAAQSRKKKLLNQLFRRAERQLTRANAFVAGGSQTELAEIRRLKPAALTAFLPATYTPVPAPRANPAAGIRIVHLGTLTATANQVGLERFLRVCWPSLRAQFPTLECLVIGDLGATPSAALTGLLGQPGVRTLGYVPVLTSVLHPYDVFVIPYEHDTGTRTRLPVALNYNQLLVAHKNACKGIAGLEHRENCLLAGSLEEMTGLIAQVLAGEIDPRPIADRGRQLFEKAFTVEGQLPRLKSFLSGIFGG